MRKFCEFAQLQDCSLLGVRYGRALRVASSRIMDREAYSAFLYGCTRHHPDDARASAACPVCQQLRALDDARAPADADAPSSAAGAGGNRCSDGANESS